MCVVMVVRSQKSTRHAAGSSVLRVLWFAVKLEHGGLHVALQVITLLLRTGAAVFCRLNVSNTRYFHTT